MYPINVKCIKDNSDFNLINGQIYLGIVKQGCNSNVVVEIHLPHAPNMVYCAPEEFSKYFQLTV